jgi:hypothetical protein
MEFVILTTSGSFLNYIRKVFILKRMENSYFGHTEELQLL